MSGQRCGKCKYAKWSNHSPGYWGEIHGHCIHPALAALPCPNPPEIGLYSGVYCGAFVADPHPVIPKRSNKP